MSLSLDPESAANTASEHEVKSKTSSQPRDDQEVGGMLSSNNERGTKRKRREHQASRWHEAHNYFTCVQLYRELMRL